MRHFGVPRDRSWLSLLALAFCLLFLACDRPPVIEQITFSRTPVPPSDTVTVTAIANSPMGEALSYHWAAVRGTSIDAVGNPVVFKSSKVAGFDTIALTVLDSHAREAVDTLAVDVRSK